MTVDAALPASAVAGRTPLRVVLVDDHRIFLDSLGHVLSREEDLEIVGVALSLEHGEEQLVGWDPDVVVLDRRMPDGDGLTRVSRMARLVPRARIVVLSSQDSPHAREQALATGASAYVCKSAGVGEVLDAVRGVEQADAVEEVRRRRLTEREASVLQLMADGLTNPAIAAELGLGTSTVRSHVARLAVKLGAHSKLDTVSRARRAGLIC